MSKLYVIAGPTASGKTAVAIELAKLTNGEVISADSMQIYKGMDIGTAKPNCKEMQNIPHHMLNIISPHEPFSAAEYQQQAVKIIDDIIARKKTPVLAGGTGFYINAVIYGTEFPHFSQETHETETVLRKKYAALAQEKGADFLHEILKTIDAESSKTIHPNNVKRVARAISFCEATGELFSAHNSREKLKREYNYDTVFCAISLSRETLYNRINSRVVDMWNAGLPEEVRNLLSQGYHLGLTAMQGIGYKETIKFLNSEMTEAETIATIQQATRNYAKRQETWFRNQSPDARRLLAEGKTPQELAREIVDFSR